MFPCYLPVIYPRNELPPADFAVGLHVTPALDAVYVLTKNGFLTVLNVAFGVVFRHRVSSPSIFDSTLWVTGAAGNGSGAPDGVTVANSDGQVRSRIVSNLPIPSILVPRSALLLTPVPFPLVCLLPFPGSFFVWQWIPRRCVRRWRGVGARRWPRRCLVATAYL